MSKLETAPVTAEELEIALVPVYETSDFEFVAFAKAYNNPPTDVINARGVEDPDAVDSRKNLKLIFQLAGPNGEDITDALRELSRLFLNGSTTIEPKKLLAERKWLRVWMLDAKKLQKGRVMAHRIADPEIGI